MANERAPGALTGTGVQAVVGFLDGAGVAFELIEHESTVSASAEARVMDRSPREVAKTVVLHDDSVYVIAAVSAADRLDLHKLRELLGSSRRLRLASEAEIAQDFPSLEVGAVPPFGPMVPAAEVIDRALLEQRRIMCPAGDRRHSVLVDPHDVVRITAATVADVSED